MQPCTEVIPGSATGAAGAAKPAPAEQVGLLTVPRVIANFCQVLGMPLIGFGACGVGGVKTVKLRSCLHRKHMGWNVCLYCRSLVML